MGRPNQCNPCCGSVGSVGSVGQEELMITDCKKVICVAFIDENKYSIGGSTFESKLDRWRVAYPERLLFILDVVSDVGMTYPQNFEPFSLFHPQSPPDKRNFSLRKEYSKSTPGAEIQYIQRDNGDTGIAESNNPWQRIKQMAEHYLGTITLFGESSEVAIFIDNSSSMTAGQVRATVEKLKLDARSDGMIIAKTIINGYEDVICPFVQGSCGQYAYGTAAYNAATSLVNECGGYQGIEGENQTIV